MLLHLQATATFPKAINSTISSAFRSCPVHLPLSHSPFPLIRTHQPRLQSFRPMNWLGKLGFGRKATPNPTDEVSKIAQGPDEDIPAEGEQFAQFGAGCFWGVELAFQRIPGVSRTEVGYSQGFIDNPTYDDICSGTTNHSEIVRVHYDPLICKYDDLLDVFWKIHNPTTLNRQVSLLSFYFLFFYFLNRLTILKFQ